MKKLILFGLVLFATPCGLRADSPSSVQREEGKEDFAQIGIGAGTPAGIDLVGGVSVGSLGIRVSGGYWGAQWNGVQGDLLFRFTRSGSFAQALSILGGVYRVNPFRENDQGVAQRVVRRQPYAGIAYDLDLSGFFLQTGLGFGKGDYPSPQLILQMGYLIEF